MTLAFALRGSDGLVLGADSRVSGPFGTSDTSTKFLQVNREIGVLTYGLAEVGYKAITRLIDDVNSISDFSQGANKKTVHWSTIVEKAQKIFKETFDDFMPEIQKEIKTITPEDPRLSTGFILAGYDANETNQFRIVHFQSPKFELENRSDIIAAQWHVSQYIVNHFYYPEMNVDQLKRLATFLLIETETVSPSVGGQQKIATVTLRGGFQQLNEKDVENLINENQPRFAKFRRILLDNLRSV